MPGLRRFLLGRFFYSDAVNTVIVVMSVVAVEAVGLTARDANLVLLGLTVVAIAMSFVWGWLVDRLGPRRTLLIVLALVGGRAGHRRCVDGLGGRPDRRCSCSPGRSSAAGWAECRSPTGCSWSASSPPERLGEFFGLYGLVGKATQVIGQLLYGAIVFAVPRHARQRRLPARGR